MLVDGIQNELHGISYISIPFLSKWELDTQPHFFLYIIAVVIYISFAGKTIEFCMKLPTVILYL